MSTNQNKPEYALAPGTLLKNGCYRIVRKLSQGGFSITYLAVEVGVLGAKGHGFTKFERIQRHPTNTGEVVIKELFYKDFCTRDSLTNIVEISHTEKNVEFQKLVNRQEREGLTLRRLVHNHIVTNHDIFTENGTAYIVMDYLKGQTLEERISTHKESTGEPTLPVANTVRYMSQICSAVVAAHAKRIIHFDIKPSNIFIRSERKIENPEDGSCSYVPDDSAVLIDFGAAYTYDKDEKVEVRESSLIAVATMAYAPPEQQSTVALAKFQPTFDTFALAGTFYHCLTGTLPPNPSIRSSGTVNLKPPSEIDDRLRKFDKLLDKGLRLPFRERYQKAEEFCIALTPFIQEVVLSDLGVAEQKIQANDYDSAIKAIQSTQELALLFPTVEKTQLKKVYEFLLQKERFEDLVNLMVTPGLWNSEAAKKSLGNLFQKIYTVLLKKGQEHEKSEDHKTALELYELSGTLLPNSSEHLKHIESCNQKISEKEALIREKAAQEAKRLEQIAVAQTLERNEKYYAACELLQTLDNAYPNDTDIQEMLKRVLEKIEDTIIVLPETTPDPLAGTGSVIDAAAEENKDLKPASAEKVEGSAEQVQHPKQIGDVREPFYIKHKKVLITLLIIIPIAIAVASNYKTWIGPAEPPEVANTDSLKYITPIVLSANEDTINAWINRTSMNLIIGHGWVGDAYFDSLKNEVRTSAWLKAAAIRLYMSKDSFVNGDLKGGARENMYKDAADTLQQVPTPDSNWQNQAIRHTTATLDSIAKAYLAKQIAGRRVN